MCDSTEKEQEEQPVDTCFICPRCPLCLEKTKVSTTEKYYLNPQTYENVVMKSFLEKKTSNEIDLNNMALHVLDTFKLPCVGGITVPLIYQSYNMGIQTYMAPRSGDILVGIELSDVKNVDYVDLYIANHFLKRIKYEGKPIFFYKDGMVGFKKHLDSNNKITFCEVDGLPMISLMYHEVQFRIPGIVSCIGHYLYVDKKKRVDLAQNPLYFNVDGLDQFKCHKGGIVQMKV